ncbi:AAA family ATPase [bacterium]|nr:AAA family ATPase [bacterium]
MESVKHPTAWFVGAFYNDTDDHTARFLAEGVWENGYDDKYLELVRSMRPGDRIAIKSSYVRKHGLPFDNRGLSVSVMAIKAIGTIVENLNDGQRVRVDWMPVTPAREWYFYTHRATIWRVQAGDWMTDGLIAFAFEGDTQDYARFCNAPFWRERFGTQAPEAKRFGWTKFYEAIADKLLAYRDDRKPLLEAIQGIAQHVEGLGHLSQDEYPDGTTGFLRDICPFTVMGLFNRGITDANRRIIMKELGQFLGVEEPIPESFEGIPVLNNLKSWYFPRESARTPDHIDSLWALFAAALAFAESDDEEARARFSLAFDHANGRPLVAWNLTFGLYWIRPWSFLSLDSGSKLYITKKLGVPIERHGPKGLCNATDYLAIMDALIPRFQEPSYPAHSFPELSLSAWHYKDPSATTPSQPSTDPTDESEDEDPGLVQKAESLVPYSIDDVLQEGCFLTRKELDQLLVRLRTKKNLILQGPPGTGKTWLAKRLAFSLIGQKDESKVRAVQFHPNLSYEDFVRGWRPTGDGKLSLADGIFMEAIKAAAKAPMSRFVVVIEEINRGNPAQIFGELLTLLEAGKRTPSEALELCYPDADGVRRPVHIPENLHVIGTMNIADRSLALVDLALRRRFAFADLEPRLGPAWRDWVTQHCGLEADLANDIEARLEVCNATIAGDARLGKQFRVGHSYVTPPYPLEPGETRSWFRQVVETEIGPLLEEYWFDSPAEAKKARELLLKDWE